jgi:UDP-2,3-diacylglucosamine pyrophosphatase LpxH
MASAETSPPESSNISSNNSFGCLIQIISDIHLELSSTLSSSSFPRIPVAKHAESGEDANILVLAGDIGNLKEPNSRKLKEFLEYCSRNWSHVIYVPGNHEFYHSKKTHQTLRKEYQTLCAEFHNVYWLYNDMKIINGVRFYGTPLFTKLNVSKEAEYSGLNDLRYIHTKNDKYWTVPMTIRQWNQELSEPCHSWLSGVMKDTHEHMFLRDIPIVCITHFPPIREGTSHPKYDTQSVEIKEYFANDIHNTLFRETLPKSSIVISGHTHYSYDMILDDIRYISHQMGYRDEIDDSGFMECFREVIKITN